MFTTLRNTLRPSPFRAEMRELGIVGDRTPMAALALALLALVDVLAASIALAGA